MKAEFFISARLGRFLRSTRTNWLTSGISSPPTFSRTCSAAGRLSASVDWAGGSAAAATVHRASRSAILVTCWYPLSEAGLNRFVTHRQLTVSSAPGKPQLPVQPLSRRPGWMRNWS